MINDITICILRFLDTHSQLKIREVCKKLCNVMNSEGLNLYRNNLTESPLGKNIRVRSLRISLDDLENIVKFCNEHRTESISFIYMYSLPSSNVKFNPRTFKIDTLKSITFEHHGDWSDRMLGVGWAPFMECLIIRNKIWLDEAGMARLFENCSRLKKLCIGTSASNVIEPLKWLKKFEQLNTLYISVNDPPFAQDIIDACKDTAIRKLRLIVTIQRDHKCKFPQRISINEDNNLNEIVLGCSIHTIYNDYMFSVDLKKELKTLVIHGGFKINSTVNQKTVVMRKYGDPVDISCKEIKKVHIIGYPNGPDISGIGIIEEMLITIHSIEIDLPNVLCAELQQKAQKTVILIDDELNPKIIEGVEKSELVKKMHAIEYYNYSVYTRNGKFIYKPTNETHPKRQKICH